EIEKYGGVVPGIEAGYFQQEIARSAERQQRELEQRERLVVGVNAFTEGNEHVDIDILRISDEPERRQRERLASLRARRDPERVEATLAALRTAAAEDRNVIEPLLDCARAGCTLYEMRYAMEEVF